MKLAEFSVKHSLFVNLLSVFLLVAGVTVMVTMRREAFPTISFDLITIDTIFTGASPEEVERFIAIPLENELKEVDDIEEMSSFSYENRCMIVLKVDPDAPNVDRLVSDVQQAVDQARDELPDDVEDPIVDKIDSRDRPVLFVSIAGDVTETELQRLARVLENRLLDIPNVGRIVRTGWRDPEIWVEADPEKLKTYHISLSEIMQALRDKNLNLPGGKIREHDMDLMVRTMGELENAAGVGNVIVRANDQGNWVRVRDVAEVKNAFEDDELIERTRGKRAISLNVIKREKGDVIEVVRAAKQIGDSFDKEHAEIEVTYFNDFSYYVNRRLRVLVNNGFIGIILVVLALLIFMNATTALMTALGLPIAFATTFLLMHVFGYNINLITMFALIMVVGLVVDDAIVISENIYRYIETGLPPHEAAIRGASEVMGPVIATVLTTVSAFSPLFFMTDRVGKFVSSIPIIVIIALSASLTEALIILPSHMADFVRAPKEKPGRKKSEAHWFLWLRERYVALLTWVLSHRYKASIIITIIFVTTFLFYRTFGRYVQFPGGLIEEFFVYVEAPVGTSLNETAKRIEPIEAAISALPPSELDNYVTRIGLIQTEHDDAARQRGSHVGQIAIYLTPAQTRARSANAIMEHVRQQVGEVEEFERVTFELARAGPPVGKAVEVQIRGEDYGQILPMAEEFKLRLSALKGVRDIRDDYEEGKDELRIRVDEDKAMSMGLSIRDIANELRFSFEGGVATSIKTTEDETDIVVKIPEEKQNNIDIMERILIPNAHGQLIPLRRVAGWSREDGISSIQHLERQRVVKVTAGVDEDVITPVEVGNRIGSWLEALQPEYPANIVVLGGEYEETKKSNKNLMYAFFLGLFLIFVILASQFNSLIQPLVVMLAIPFGIVGVVWAFFLHGQPMSFMSLLGLLGLSGVVVNDSIVLVDFINKERSAGHERRQSIINACRLRLRPVLLTSITTVLGLGPVAYGIGGFDPFVAPMALAISWGLFCATGLTLIIIPCVYAIVDDAKSLIEELRTRYLPNTL